MLKHGGVYPAKVDRMLGVFVFQASQVGVWPVQAPLDRTTDQEHRRGRAVVSARAGVFAEATAKLREDQHGHSVSIAGTVNLRHERLDRTAQFEKPRRVLIELIGVRVEAAELSVVDRSRKPCLDRPSNQPQPAGQSIRIGVFERAVALEDRFEPVLLA